MSLTENNPYLYRFYYNMMQRCFNPRSPRYSCYGERGITVCKEWTGVDGRIIFSDYVINNIGERPSKGHSIDRINNDGNYEPGNLRWATVEMQAKNRRARTKIRYYKGNAYSLELL